VSADGTQVTVDSTVTTPTYLLAGIAFSASSYATSTNILLPLPRAGLWPHATVFSQGDYIGRQLTEAAYFIRQSGPAAALQDMHVAEPSKYADAAAAWAFYKTHWEVDGGLGVGVLTSDIGAPNNTSGTRWGSNGTGMLITPRI
jgi:hypothetical protein